MNPYRNEKAMRNYLICTGIVQLAIFAEYLYLVAR